MNWRWPEDGGRYSRSLGLATGSRSVPSRLLKLSRRTFSDRQIQLLKTFADQAVIAIENVRLFDEVQARTRELTELLDQQTATSEVLKVISRSPGELEPVFEAMLASATRICDAKFGNIYRWDRDSLRLVATHNTPPAYAQLRRSLPFRPGPENSDRSHDGYESATHVADLALEPGYVERDPLFVEGVEVGGIRTLLSVPMVKENELIGAFSIYRHEVRPFTDKQIELVKNFAAQAVIAIENTRLLNELQRTEDSSAGAADRDLGGARRSSASSPGELEPVFNAMLANATRICEATFGNLFLREGDGYRAATAHGEPAFVERWRRTPFVSLRDAPLLDRVTRTKQVLHIPDLRQDQSYRDGNQRIVALVDSAGARTFVSVPMLKDSEIVGTFAIYRQEVRPFTEKQIELVKNFAAQAVIAIENTRLLNELRESLQQQTATADVLKVISSSPGELEPVFTAMLESATRLCAAKFGNLYICEGDAFRTVAMHNVPPAFAEVRRRDPLVRPGPGSTLGRLRTSKRIVHIPDVTAEQGYIERQPVFVTAVELGGFRSLLAVPMLKDGIIIGAIIIYRQETGTFSDKQIALVQNFAAQAVIAIENTRLLNELREFSSSKPPQPTCSRSSAGQPLICRQCSIRWFESAARLCEAEMVTICPPKGRLLSACRVLRVFARISVELWKNAQVKLDRGQRYRASHCSSTRPFRFTTF